jgi:uncharacterized protein YxjI
MEEINCNHVSYGWRLKMSMLDTREFIVNQKLLSVRNTYVIKNRHGDRLGFIKKEFVSLGPHFWFEDNSGTHLGEICGKVMTIHNEYEIKNKSGQVKARVKKKIVKLFGSEWWMEDALGKKIARIKGNIVHHTYEMTAPDKTAIAKVHLKWATIREEYCVEIVKPEFDPLLVLGYAVAMDMVEHQSNK